ncbi:MAG: polysaccharide deacetylase family protein [Bacteroidales bacterium]|nr:polysaccharide deacetylase family protein [Bacteroidales bacterium]
MRLFRPCFVAGCLYPGAVFRIKTNEKLLCLTFDDGPHQDSTPKLLDILEKHNIKAVFFCTGKSAGENPVLINQIISGGHMIGNHGFSHLNGWITSLNRYIEEVSDAAPFTSRVIFRPPYGRIRFDQFRKLRKTYKIVFWDIMPYDFDKKFGAGNSLKILKKMVRPGSVVVLHDSPGSSSNDFLEEFIVFSIEKGYRFVFPEF